MREQGAFIQLGEKKEAARNLMGQGIHNCVMNIAEEEKWACR